MREYTKIMASVKKNNAKNITRFRFKANQVIVEQEIHNRDLQIRTDHEEMILERDIYHQDQVLMQARQQLLLQRDMM